jgi:PAS domain-containing protein
MTLRDAYEQIQTQSDELQRKNEKLRANSNEILVKNDDLMAKSEELQKANETLEEKVKQRTAELEKAYISLKESEERLADAQRIAHVGSYDWNIATNEEYWSDELYHIFGLDPQFELNHNTFLNWIHPEDLEYVSHAINEALNGKPYNIDYRIILPDGKERIIYSQGGAIFDEKNTPIRMRGNSSGYY